MRELQERWSLPKGVDSREKTFCSARTITDLAFLSVCVGAGGREVGVQTKERIKMIIMGHEL